MRILIACEFSGIVRDAFIKEGHDTISCDLLPTDRPGPHSQGDVLDIVNDGFDMMIAHPPCTFLSNAGARFLYPGGVLNKDRYEAGMEAKELFMALYNAPIKHKCIENPIPSRVFKLPPYSQFVQPYEHGHPYKKKTCLWLDGLPHLMPSKMVTIAESTKVPGNWFNKGGKDRQKNRAKTFQGIATAMAGQWGSV